MYGPMHSATQGVNAYAQVAVETGVEAADPHKLILMLLDGALMCIASAHQHMLKNEIAAKGENVSKAIEIISNGLKASLNTEAGGELAQRLSALYDYMCSRLLYANAHNKPAGLDEVRNLLNELKDAWTQIGDDKAG